MKIGDLRHRISLYRSEYTSDDWGNQIEELVNVGEVWAFVTNLHGREYYAAASIQQQKEVRFVIRYLEGVTEKTTILFNGSKYDITFVDDLKYKGEWLEIRAKLKKR